MKKIFISFLCLVLLASCENNTSGHNAQAARQLFADGKKILSDRISIQHLDRAKANNLNIEAIKKFTAAYNADTSFSDAVLFASECTMFARDYKKCVYWTSKLIRLDTSRQNVIFCTNRLQYCNEQLRSGQEKGL